MTNAHFAGNIDDAVKAVAFVIPGRPTAWQRAGVSTKLGRAIMYMKPESRSYQSVVREIARQSWDGEASDAPFKLSISIFAERPKSHYTAGQIGKKLKERFLNTRCARKPDLDNVAKQIGDALNGVVWRDDSQVVALYVDRQWSDRSSVHVFIQEIKQ